MCMRTRESVILDDAAATVFLCGRSLHPSASGRSILCLPLLNQAKLIGVLYLENNLAPASSRRPGSRCLKLLASQAATSTREHPSLPRSSGTRSEDPAPGRRQHHRDFHSGP